MKKSMIALGLASVFAVTAHADPINFDENANTSLSGLDSTLTVDGIDFEVSTAAVTQTDNGAEPFPLSGTVLGSDSFVEFGAMIAADWTLGGPSVSPSGIESGAYEIWIDYTLTGVASGGASPLPSLGSTLIGIDFDEFSSFGSIYIDTTVDGTFTAGSDVIATLDHAEGGCGVFGTFDDETGVFPTGQFNVGTGSCDVDFNLHTTPGYFFTMGGTDVSLTYKPRVNFDVTVESITGLFFSYAEQEADATFGGDGIGVQSFVIEHDGNLTFLVPEPASIAILGLGLLGLAGVRRRS
jgi:hypothetical protein